MYNLFTRRALWLCAILCLALGIHAQAPAGYYGGAKGAKGKALKTALYKIVAQHTERSYNQLWQDFKQTDVRADGKIWDMYSNVTNYVPGGSAQGGQYSKEGDVYNREHSMPKSWFDEGKPMYSDLFHLYPTDGYINGRRSNFPYGETKGEKYKSNGGFSKLGSCTYPGYTGTVFEPADEYKGDLARTYFYMATAYENKISSWKSPVFAGNSYPAYASWVISMFLKWAAEDPVSEKEIARNNAIYGIQHNRNPFIDFPGLEQYIWGDKQDEAFDPDNYAGGTVQPGQLATPRFSPASGKVVAGTVVTISADQGTTIHYTVNGAAEQTHATPVSLTINEATTLTAYATLDDRRSQTVTATYQIKDDQPTTGNDVYTLVTSTAEITDGAQLLIVCVDQGKALSAQAKDYRSAADVTVSNDKIKTEANGDDLPYIIVPEKVSDNLYTLYCTGDKTYLSLTSDGNKLYTATTATDASTQWSISVAGDGTATISSAKYPGRMINYNAKAPRFATYKSTSGQQPVALFVSAGTTGLTGVWAQSGKTKVNVCDLTGRIVRQGVTLKDALTGLPAGLYIVGGKKVLVR